MTWRKKWANNWAEVKYCSDACRRRGLKPQDDALAAAILALLDSRGASMTICPSEAARQVGGDQWQVLNEPARAAARRLSNEGKIQMLQKGHIVDPSTARGPVRLKLA